MPKEFLEMMNNMNIMFFNIAAHGHTNPTIEVTRELVKRGHQVHYYSFLPFQQKIEETGAVFISIDTYLPPLPKELEHKVGRDFSYLIEMNVDTTIALDNYIKKEVESFQPDCLISDSVCFWGKLFSKKYHIPMICSTTTLAFNQYTSKMMKQGLKEIWLMFKGMPKINKKMKELSEYGFEVDNFLSLIQNDNETNTIVYTSRRFQPMVETFSDHYAFVGPSIKKITNQLATKNKIVIYISLGTVLYKNLSFYKECIKAFKNIDCEVIISIGEESYIDMLGEIPTHIHVFPRVNQLEVLSYCDVFLTHCGMNSVQESLYYGVPMILYPQHSEENAVALRVEQLKAGVFLKKAKSHQIQEAYHEIMNHNDYKKSAMEMSADFHQCGGAEEAVDFIETCIIKNSDN